MANFINKNIFELKISRNSAVFNGILDKIWKLYKTRTDSCTKYVQAGLAILLKDTKLKPSYVVITSRGNHPGQRHIQNQQY